MMIVIGLLFFDVFSTLIYSLPIVKEGTVTINKVSAVASIHSRQSK